MAESNLRQGLGPIIEDVPNSGSEASPAAVDDGSQSQHEIIPISPEQGGVKTSVGQLPEVEYTVRQFAARHVWSLGIMVLVLCMTPYVIYRLESERKATKVVAARLLGSSYASALENAFTSSADSTLSLSAIVREMPNISQPQFNRIANDLIQSFKGVDNLQLAQAGVVRYVHPLAGNEAAVGFDNFANPERAQGAYATIQSRSLTLVGPLNLVQGFTGMIARYPIFVNSTASNPNGDFWGFSNAIIRTDSLIEVAKIPRLYSQSYEYSIRKLSAVDNIDQYTVFAKSPGWEGVSDEDPAVLTVTIPTGAWQLQLVPIGGWGVSTDMFLDIGMALVAFIFRGFMLRNAFLRERMLAKFKAGENVAMEELV